MKTPDTHPGEFRLMYDGEVVTKQAVYDQGGNYWMSVDASVGRIQTKTKDGRPFYIPINQPSPQPTESNHTMSLQAITIMSTTKVVPGSIPATEEILVPTTEISAPDTNAALILVAAQNADTILKTAKTSTLRVIVRSIG